MSTRLARAKDEASRWATVVLIVLVAVLGFYMHSVSATVDHLSAASSRTEASANVAATAASSAKTTLEGALAQQRNGAVSADAVREAVASIHRIEVAVCGGPCPEPTGG